MWAKEPSQVASLAAKLSFDMATPEQLKKIKELYSKNLGEMGVSSKAVGWKTEESQRMRFAKLASVIHPSDSGITINDYGCGYGAMLKYFLENQRPPVLGYNGYDISTEMLAAAAHELASFTGELNLLQSSTINTESDYSFISGTFNVRFDATREAWEVFIREKLQELHTFSRKGFAFNLLTSYVDYEEAHLYYGNPCYWFDYCKRHFSKRVSLLHDYPLWEWTMIVRKQE